MKKLLSIIFVIAMMFPAAACAGSEDEQEHNIEIKPLTIEPARQMQEETYNDGRDQYDTGSDTDAVSKKEYTAGNIRILVEEDGAGGMEFNVYRSDAKLEADCWKMSGRPDESTGAVEYDNAVKEFYKFTEDGTLIADDLYYEGGTGRFVFEGETRLVWEDDEEGAGNGLVFEYRQ